MDSKSSLCQSSVIVNIPSSKSLSNRWLIINYLLGNTLCLNDLSTADDTRLLQLLLKQLEEKSSNVFDCKNAGTVARFLTALLSMQSDGEYILTGDCRMCQRPIKPLVDALLHIGADVSYLDKLGYLPLKIKEKKYTTNVVRVSGSVSSQFISALMLIAISLPNGLKIIIDDKCVSQSYIFMTMTILKQLGVGVQWKNKEITIEKAKPFLKSKYVEIEKDWSSGAYFYNWVLFSDDFQVFISGLYKDSVQGDSVVADIYDALGVETIYTGNGIFLRKKNVLLPKVFKYDFSSCPDLVLTVAVACVGIGVDAEFLGLDTLPYKETNRIEALETELKKMNIDVFVHANVLYIKSVGNLCPTLPVATYNDHRMAMSFASLKMINKDLFIENPDVVVKSFPEYWEEVKKFL